MAVCVVRLRHHACSAFWCGRASATDDLAAKGQRLKDRGLTPFVYVDLHKFLPLYIQNAKQREDDQEPISTEIRQLARAMGSCLDEKPQNELCMSHWNVAYTRPVGVRSLMVKWCASCSAAPC